MKTIIAIAALAITATTVHAETAADFATPAQEVYLSTVTDADEAKGRLAAIYAGELANREAYVRQIATTTPMPIFTLEISQGEPIVTRRGPLMEFGQCDYMMKQATADITASYATSNPDGWTDAEGNVWQLADWNIECVRVQPYTS